MGELSCFVPDAYTYVTFNRKYDSQGKVWMQAYAHGALTALTPYFIIANEYGRITAAITDVTKYVYIGVPQAAVAADATAWLQIGGYVVDMVTPSLTVTAGHGLYIYNGAVADIGADYSGAAGEFCVNTVTTAIGVEIHTVMLVPEQILTTS